MFKVDNKDTKTMPSENMQQIYRIFTGYISHLVLVLIAGTFDIFMLPETKLDYTFTSAQFSINWFFAPHRLDRNDKGGGILLFVRERLIVLPLEKYSLPSNIEAMFFELNLRSKKWLLCCSYNPHKSLVKEHLKELIQNIQQF